MDEKLKKDSSGQKTYVPGLVTTKVLPQNAKLIIFFLVLVLIVVVGILYVGNKTNWGAGGGQSIIVSTPKTNTATYSAEKPTKSSSTNIPISTPSAVSPVTTTVLPTQTPTPTQADTPIPTPTRTQMPGGITY